MKINYNRLMEEEIKSISAKNIKPKLLLHSCCAPCASNELEFLPLNFEVSVYFYNPNIYPEKEYFKRKEEFIQFLKEFPNGENVKFIDSDYIPNEFYTAIKGLEDIKEGGERCFRCYELRLRKTAQKAILENFDYFTTVLSVSPHKNAAKINEIGKKIEIEMNEKYKSNIKFLYADFKKKNGFKRSIELSNQYNLYRQDYCGCVFSKKESLN